MARSRKTLSVATRKLVQRERRKNQARRAVEQGLRVLQGKEWIFRTQKFRTLPKGMKRKILTEVLARHHISTNEAGLDALIAILSTNKLP